MWKDPIVEETRRVREELAAEFDYDLEKFSNFLLAAQSESRKSLIKKEDLLNINNKGEEIEKQFG